MQANVHITPMRASRALALRYLATKFSTDTENIAVSASSPCCCAWQVLPLARPDAWYAGDMQAAATRVLPISCGVCWVFRIHAVSVPAVHA